MWQLQLQTTESNQQHLALDIDHHLRSITVMIEGTSRHLKCTHFNLDYSRMSAVALQCFCADKTQIDMNRLA